VPGRLLEVMPVPTVSLGIVPMMTERSGVPQPGSGSSMRRWRLARLAPQNAISRH
jgi:hypothetical protein